MQLGGVVDGEAAKLKVLEGDIAGAIRLAEESCPDIFEASLRQKCHSCRKALGDIALLCEQSAIH